MLAGSLVVSFFKGTRRQGLLLFAALVFFLGAAIYIEDSYDRRWEYFLNVLGMGFVIASLVFTTMKWFGHLKEHA
jgi:hypothetical protein